MSLCISEINKSISQAFTASLNRPLNYSLLQVTQVPLRHIRILAVYLNLLFDIILLFNNFILNFIRHQGDFVLILTILTEIYFGTSLFEHLISWSLGIFHEHIRSIKLICNASSCQKDQLGPRWYAFKTSLVYLLRVLLILFSFERKECVRILSIFSASTPHHFKLNDIDLFDHIDYYNCFTKWLKVNKNFPKLWDYQSEVCTFKHLLKLYARILIVC